MLENHVGIKLSFSNQLGEELKSLINHIDQIESKILRVINSIYLYRQIYTYMYNSSMYN